MKKIFLVLVTLSMALTLTFYAVDGKEATSVVRGANDYTWPSRNWEKVRYDFNCK